MSATPDIPHILSIALGVGFCLVGMGIGYQALGYADDWRLLAIVASLSFVFGAYVILDGFYRISLDDLYELDSEFDG